LVIGCVAFFFCHVLTFLFVIADDADTGALDIILRPLKLWLRAFANMPQRLWVTVLAAGGLTAVITSMLIIGGLPYDRLWDWGFEKRKSPNLISAVLSQKDKVEGKGADNLEDAVKDFAGNQNVDQMVEEPVIPKPRLQADCVILGYRVDAAGNIRSLILGTALRKQLVFACSVTPQLSSEQNMELLELLNHTQSHQPYLPLQLSAEWVILKYSCRVSFESQEKSGRLLNPSWEKFLGSLD